MPNWCSNVVKLTHSDPAQLQRARESARDNNFCQEFVPLPDLENNNAYEWCVSNWGTKWDIQTNFSEVEDQCLTLNFDTAWSPPLPVYAALQDQGFEVQAFYYEPGMAFAGMWTNGQDLCYDIPFTADQVEKTLPKELDDMFTISVNMDMWAQIDGAEK